MANQTIIAAKAAHVDEIEKKIAASQSVGVVDYSGYTLEQHTELRNNFRKAGIEYAVIKNSILERASAQAGIDVSIDEYLKGPTAVAFGTSDPVAPAKIIKEFIKKSKKGAIKAES
jgi:large subunit ribosomal protein L10